MNRDSFAEGLKPPADIHLRVRFAAVVPGMRFVRRFLRPFEDRQLRITAVDRDPSDRPLALLPANLTSIDRVNHQKPPVELLPNSATADSL